MQRVLTLAMAGVLAMLVSTRAEAQTFTFTAALHGGNEVPAVVTGSAGTATVTLNTTTGVLTYRVEVYNMPVGTTAGHIHVGAAGVGGPTVINFTIPPGGISNDFALTGTATATDLTLRQAFGIGSWDDFQQALLLGNMYVNVHSTNNPGGEIRGQLTRVP
jgi:CHRD domain